MRKGVDAEREAREKGNAAVEAKFATMEKQLQEVAVAAKNFHMVKDEAREIGRAFGKTLVDAARGVRKAASEGTGSEGGYLVEDQQVLDRILSVQNEYGTVRQLMGGNIFPMASDYVSNIPVDEFEVSGVSGTGNVPTPAATSENAAITESAYAALSTVTLTAQKYATLNYLPNELLDDSRIDFIGSYMLPKMARMMAKVEDTVVFTTATTGVLASTNMQVVNMDAGDIAFADLLDPAKCVKYLQEMQDAVASSALMGAQYVMHRSIVGSLRSVRGTDNYLWTPMAGGEPAQILGYSYNKSEIFPAKSGTASAKGFIMFGNLAQGIVIGERMTRRIVRDDSFRFNYDQVALRLTERFAYATNANIGHAIAVLKTAAA
jgi:HK97 family phage major capsid protein